MTIEVTPQNFLTACSVLTAAILLIQRFAKGVRWFDKQEQQTTDLAQLKKQHEDDMAAMRTEIVSELQLLTYGVLACLKGQQEQGLNGPVTEAANKIEQYLNQKAHKV